MNRDVEHVFISICIFASAGIVTVLLLALVGGACWLIVRGVLAVVGA